MKESAVAHTVRVFAWWFVVGATMALAVILLQGGIREAMQAQGSVWELKLMELMTTVLGGRVARWLYCADIGSYQKIVRTSSVLTAQGADKDGH